MTTERETRNTNILKQNGDLIFTVHCMKWIALFQQYVTQVVYNDIRKTHGNVLIT